MVVVIDDNRRLRSAPSQCIDRGEELQASWQANSKRNEKKIVLFLPTHHLQCNGSLTLSNMKSAVQLVVQTALAVVFLASATSGQGTCCEDYCYSSDKDKVQVTRYSTKTPYQVAKGASTNNDYRIPNCTPKKIWLLNRHGTRLPKAKEIGNMRKLEQLRDEIIDNYDQRRSFPDRGSLCDTDLAGFRNWQWNTSITEDQDQFLVQQGWEDMKFIGRRFQKIYSDLINIYYEPEKFLFRHTDTQRTEASFHAFTEGIFGFDSWKNINVPPPPANDTLLKFYDECPAWEQQSKSKNDPSSEYQKFMKSDVFQQLKSDVSQRLGFKFALPEKQIDTIWDTCRYEQAWRLDQYSPWCAAFTKRQVEVLEYLEDIKYYYKQGYGSDMNPNLACFLVQDLLMQLESQEEPRVVAYFAHSSTVQLFLTSLGVAKDRDALRADNFESMKYRSWRTSKLGPFAANIAAVKYDCPKDPEPTKIMFFLNEKPVNFEWCKVGLCDFKSVLDHFKRFRNVDCQSYFCEGSAASGLSTSVIVVFSSALILSLAKYFLA